MLIRRKPAAQLSYAYRYTSLSIKEARKLKLTKKAILIIMSSIKNESGLDVIIRRRYVWVCFATTSMLTNSMTRRAFVHHGSKKSIF